MKKAILFIIIFNIVSIGYAQQSDTTIVFKKLTHDFGSIAQDSGKVNYSFEFMNKGVHPVIVQNATTSCGCTTSGWTKEPVEPGKTGYVTVSYNPQTITTFEKTITVKFLGGNPESIKLYIRGSVKATAENP